jgi:hypothetical protein
MAGFLSVSSSPETEIRRLGPGDEEVIRRLAEGTPQTPLLENDAANALYESLGGTRIETVMWDF